MTELSSATLQALDTPCVLVDLDIVDRNIDAAQALLSRIGLANRPHVKTHKIPQIAMRQLAAGAVGLTCQKISEAEVFADAGCSDIFIPYNIVGDVKLARLQALAGRVKLTVSADSAETIGGLARWFRNASAPLGVLVECDTGQHRCGVRRPEDVPALASLIARSPGLHFLGLMTYPPRGRNADVNAWLERAHGLCIGAGLSVTTVSVGGTPQLPDAGDFKVATEYRPGTYVYNDRSLVAKGLFGWDRCALRVAATVVSRPDENLAIIDAGSKTITTDLMGLEGFGYIPEYPEARLRALNEEHGYLDLAAVGGGRPRIGEVITVIPNHACVVSNMVDSVIFHRGGDVEGRVPVAARGRVS